VARVQRGADLQESARAIAELAQEIDSFDRRPAAFRASACAQRIAPVAREARLQQQVQAQCRIGPLGKRPKLQNRRATGRAGREFRDAPDDFGKIERRERA